MPSKELKPAGRCSCCGQLVPGISSRRYKVCTLMLDVHLDPIWYLGLCIGSGSFARPLNDEVRALRSQGRDTRIWHWRRGEGVHASFGARR